MAERKPGEVDIQLDDVSDWLGLLGTALSRAPTGVPPERLAVDTLRYSTPKSLQTDGVRFAAEPRCWAFGRN